MNINVLHFFLHLDFMVEFAQLGMSSGLISSDQLSFINAGSRWNWMHMRAKLFSNGDQTTAMRGAWLSDIISGHWFQIDLYILHYISGIITQGSPDQNYFIAKYSVALSNNTLDWSYIKKPGTDVNMVFASLTMLLYLNILKILFSLMLM